MTAISSYAKSAFMLKNFEAEEGGEKRLVCPSAAELLFLSLKRAVKTPEFEDYEIKVTFRGRKVPGGVDIQGIKFLRKRKGAAHEQNQEGQD